MTWDSKLLNGQICVERGRPARALPYVPLQPAAGSQALCDPVLRTQSQVYWQYLKLH